ncbi:hypothetical protein OZX73_07285 [Bifidobacterium sp. ESL0775]|nr:hypothetical protein [Bifidobacterium sp. ESL0775]WEV69055.1 hypothetical protein OZX73_07285 [Bifidobacterium sp. ESL0775]
MQYKRNNASNINPYNIFPEDIETTGAIASSVWHGFTFTLKEQYDDDI